jgi:hypothetical protein
MEHDGIVEWEAENLEDILELFASEELVKVCSLQILQTKRLTGSIQTVLPDEKNFFERSSVQVITGDWK